MTLRDHAERRLGFVEVIERDFPNLGLLPVAEGLDDGGVTQPLVERILREVPDLVGLYSMGAGNGGVAAALERAGRAHDIVAVGHELTPHARGAAGRHLRRRHQPGSVRRSPSGRPYPQGARRRRDDYTPIRSGSTST